MAFKCLKAETVFTEVAGRFLTNFSREGEGEQSLPADIRQGDEYLQALVHLLTIQEYFATFK